MARMPNAPGLFSITNCWPMMARSCSPTMRMTMSVALPAPNGTITLTGFDGYLSCARASAASPARPMTASSTMTRRFIRSSLKSRPLDAALVRRSETQPPRRWLRRGRLLKPLSVRQLDLHLAGDLFPALELAVEPGLRLLGRRVRRDADQLFLECVL